MSNINKLSRKEFNKLSDAIISVDVFAPSNDDLELIAKAEKLGYVKDNQYTSDGLTALKFSYQKTLASATFQTQDGLTLERTLNNPACWTDGVNIFDIDEDSGLPLDNTDEPLEGNLTVKLPINIEVEGDSLDMQAVITKVVDWNEHHFPQWELNIDESTELKLSKYTDKEYLTEIIATFAAPDTGLSGEIEFSKDDVTYTAQYTITSIDKGLEDLLDIAPEVSHNMTM